MRYSLFVSIFTIGNVRLTFPRVSGLGFFSAVVALSTTLLVLITTAPNGIALSPDSVGYVSAARSLSAGTGVTLYDSSPLTIQAPLYPTLLSLTEMLTGLDPVEGARYLNAGLFGLIVFLSGVLFRRRLVRTSFVVVGLFAVAASPVLFSVATFALTEPLFILWTLIFLLLLDNYLKEKSPALLTAIAIITGLACLTRYFGISLAVTGAALILFLQGAPFRSRLIHLFFFGAVSAAPLGAWAYRNFLLENTLFGHRDPSPYPFHHNVYFVLIRCINWFLPLDFLADRLKYTKAHFVLGAITGYVVCLAWSPGHVWVQLRPAIGRIGPEVLFAGTYLALLVAVSSMTAHEGISDRYLSPVYVPTVVILLFFLERGLGGSASSFSFRVFRHGVSLPRPNLPYTILSAWLAILVMRTALVASQLMLTGLGYSHIDWQNSETVNYLQMQIIPVGDDAAIVSNRPDAIYILSGASAASSPEARGYMSSEPRMSITSLAGKWPSANTTFLVWFYRTERAHLFEVNELEQIADLTIVEALTDGIIYEVSTK